MLQSSSEKTSDTIEQTGKLPTECCRCKKPSPKILNEDEITAITELKNLIPGEKDSLFNVFNCDHGQSIHRYCLNEDAIKVLTQCPICKASKVGTGLLVLRAIILRDKDETIKLLIENKDFDVNTPQCGKDCPECKKDPNHEWKLLHFAAAIGELPIVMYLVDEKKANVNIIDSFNETPLHAAQATGPDMPCYHVLNEAHKDVIAFLLLRGAHVNAKDFRGETPLDRALEEEIPYEPIITLLKSHGATSKQDSQQRAFTKA